MHTTAAHYPDRPAAEMKSAMRNFIVGIPIFLPCAACRKHAMTYLEARQNQFDWAVASRTNLFEFFWAFHNHVNADTGKEQMSLAQAASEYHFADPTRPSRRGQTTNWGPSFWYFFHTTAVSYVDNPTPEMRNVMRQFIVSIPIFLPCAACRQHAMIYLESRQNQFDWAVASRANLFEFFWAFHNHVNAITGKAQMSLIQAQCDYHFFDKLN
jgi:cytidine deaminase